MRAIFFMLIVSLVGSQKLKYEPIFTEGRMTVYTYEGVIMTGLPESGLSRAGVRINCGLNIIPTGQNTYLLKISHVQILEYNGIWPRDSFIPSHKLTQKLAPELTKPVKFEYSNGRVGNIQAPADLLEDVLNIHRGILNIFQITMKKSQNFYGLQEAGIEGVCLTNYIIQENKKANRITVTKSKDLNNCKEKVMIFTGAVYAELCPICQQSNRNIRASATFTHTLKPTAAGAILQEARVHEVHQFTPFNEHDGAAVMKARQHLRLVNIRPVVLHEQQVQFVNRGTLKYRFDENILGKPMKLMKVHNVEKVILDILTHLERHNQDRIHFDTPAKFLQLVQLLRSTTEETIDTLWRKSHSLELNTRRWILFALPAVGTPAALNFLKTKIQNLDISTADIVQALVLAMHQITADHQSLSIVRELFGMNHVQQIPILRQIVYLGYGSMVFRFCAEKETCPDSLFKPLHDLLSAATAHANEEDIVLGLKAIGNAGQPVSIKNIMKLLPGFGTAAATIPLKVQVDAIMALRNIAKKDPGKVQAIMIQLFMNQKNHPEIRMSACAIFLCTKPPLNSLLVLTDSLLKETNLQVASFAYSQFRYLARTSLPSLSAAGCNIAAKLLSPKFDRLGLRFSRMLHPDKFCYKLMSGVSAKAILLNNAGTPIPTVAAAKITGHTLGFSANLAEVSFRMEGLQEVIMKTLAPVRGAPDLKQIQRILNKFPDWKSLPEKVPLASAYLKLFDQEIAFVEFKRNDIEKAIQSVTDAHGKHSTLAKLVSRLENPVELHPAAALMSAELRQFVPTCVGLATELSFITAAAARANINVDARIPSSISSFSQLLNADIQLNVQLNPSVAVHSKAIMGINTPFIQSGLELDAKLHSAFSVDVTVNVNIKERNLKIDTAAVEQENEIMSFRSEVFAVSRNIENLSAAKSVPILPEAEEPSITNQRFKATWSNPTDLEVCSGIIADEDECHDQTHRRAPRPSVSNTCARMTTFGFDVCLDAKSASAVYIRHGPLYRLMGEHKARIVIRPVQSETRITRLRLEVQTGPKASAKMVRFLEGEELLPERVHPHTVLIGTSHTKRRMENQTWAKSSSYRSISTSLSGSKTTSQSSSVSSDNSGSMQHSVHQKEDRQASISKKSSNSRAHHADIRTSNDMFSSSAWRINQDLIEVNFKPGENIKGNFIGTIGTPSVTILAQAKRTDGKEQGYQLTGSMEGSDAWPRMHIRVVELKEDSSWKMCVDAAIPKAHKAMLMFRWGKDCQKYKISYEASLGRLANHPAMKIKTQWSEIPTAMISGGRVIGSGVAFLFGFSNKFKRNPSHQITQLIALTSPWTIDTIVKLPRLTIYYQGFELPLPVHVQSMTPVIQTKGFKSINEIPRLLLTMNQRECISESEQVVTFDGNELKHTILNDCYYVLTKDCSPTPKFILLMRRDVNQQRKKAIKLLISVPNVVIEANWTPAGIKFLVDNVKTTLSNEGRVIQNVRVWQNGTGIILKASSINIEQLFFDGNRVQIVLDHMMSKTCGICGLNNGEEKLLMPNQEEARDVEHLFESWTFPGQTCKDDCKVRRTFVELGKLVKFEGQESKCYSVEPVQRCLEGCSPIETHSRIANFHCVSANRSVNAAAMLNFRKKSVHVSHSVDSHTDCVCGCAEV
ncbi:vitellogenin-like isoform X2 [Chiloscyllium plagiosum]|uniref:vitellogenin-like isoform X2 n=1 Tax=Chiloscyllium plagiosum TaxID=36176 RepID=UPI001CB82F74|nr:vitellogenin-like isoform X2 [Chiloscyllium plagiosum]